MQKNSLQSYAVPITQATSATMESPTSSTKLNPSQSEPQRAIVDIDMINRALSVLSNNDNIPIRPYILKNLLANHLATQKTMIQIANEVLTSHYLDSAASTANDMSASITLAEDAAALTTEESTRKEAMIIEGDSVPGPSIKWLLQSFLKVDVALSSMGAKLEVFKDAKEKLNEEIARKKYDTFHQFTQLPYELRSRIWKHALDVPEIVALVPDVECSFEYDDQFSFSDAIMRNCTTKANLLWTSEESRALSFPKTGNRSTLVKADDHHCWVNPNVDITWLVGLDEAFAKNLLNDSMFPIQRWVTKKVAISARYWFCWKEIMYEVLRRFSKCDCSVDEVILVIGWEADFYTGQVEFVDPPEHLPPSRFFRKHPFSDVLRSAEVKVLTWEDVGASIQQCTRDSMIEESADVRDLDAAEKDPSDGQLPKITFKFYSSKITETGLPRN